MMKRLHLFVFPMAGIAVPLLALCLLSLGFPAGAAPDPKALEARKAAEELMKTNAAAYSEQAQILAGACKSNNLEQAEAAAQAMIALAGHAGKRTTDTLAQIAGAFDKKGIYGAQNYFKYQKLLIDEWAKANRVFDTVKAKRSYYKKLQALGEDDYDAHLDELLATPGLTPGQQCSLLLDRAQGGEFTRFFDRALTLVPQNDRDSLFQCYDSLFRRYIPREMKLAGLERLLADPRCAGWETNATQSKMVRNWRRDFSCANRDEKIAFLEKELAQAQAANDEKLAATLRGELLNLYFSFLVRDERDARKGLQIAWMTYYALPDREEGRRADLLGRIGKAALWLQDTNEIRIVAEKLTALGKGREHVAQALLAHEAFSIRKDYAAAIACFQPMFEMNPVPNLAPFNIDIEMRLRSYVAAGDWARAQPLVEPWRKSAPYRLLTGEYNLKAAALTARIEAELARKADAE